MKKFLRHFRLSENLIAHGNLKTPRRNLLYFFSATVFLFAFSFANAQSNFLSASNSSTFTAANFKQQQNNFNSHSNYFDDKDYYSPKYFATITSTTTGGDWDNSATWVGGTVPASGDDVIIDGPVTVNTGLAASHDLTINAGGTLSFNAGMLLEINGNYSNDGTLVAGTGNISFTGPGSSTISGSAASAFNNIIINKGSDINSVVEATGTVSNAGNISLLNGFFKMTGGTFQFTSDPNIPNTAGFWVNGAIVNSVSGGGGFSITNNGSIRVSSGTLNVGTATGNELQTASGGSVLIEGGTVNIAARLRNSAGSLTITGGTINISRIGHSNATFASFDLSLSTDLTISGNPLIVFQNANSGTAGDIKIVNSTGTKTITGGIFQIGNGSTPAG